MNDKAFLSVTIYSKDNFEAVQKTLKSLGKYFQDNNHNFEIIVIDDSSTDNHVSTLQEITSTNNLNIILIQLPWHHGLERSMLAGVDIAMGDFIIEIDYPSSDITPAMFDNLYQTAAKGFDIVSLGTSTNGNLSKIFYTVINKYSNLNFELKNEIARILSRRVINKISGIKNRYLYRKILYKSTGYPSKYIEIDSANLQSIQQKFTYRIDLALNLLFTFTNIPLYLSLSLSLIFTIFSTTSAIYAIFVYFLYDRVIEGWTTIMLLVSFGLAGLFLITGVILKYLGLILNYQKTDAPYVVKSLKRLT